MCAVIAFAPVAALSYPRSGVSDMSIDNVRSEPTPLFAITMMILGAFAAGLPMAVAIIWVCS